ncbi:hypothetical protein ACFZAE_35305 [Streptomyces scabiei]|uniref:hypothetical protein n=1 Tax=Streptomyces TaxID=1883 RepID=UPI001BFFB9B8|nr:MULTISPECIES: hypothetical protein [unclassified Streptomyces]
MRVPPPKTAHGGLPDHLVQEPAEDSYDVAVAGPPRGVRSVLVVAGFRRPAIFGRYPSRLGSARPGLLHGGRAVSSSTGEDHWQHRYLTLTPA